MIQNHHGDKRDENESCELLYRQQRVVFFNFNLFMVHFVMYFYMNKKNSQIDYLWDDLANNLGVESIPHDEYHGSHGRGKKIHAVDFCLDEYGDFRSMIMPYALNY